MSPGGKAQEGGRLEFHAPSHMIKGTWIRLSTAVCVC